MLLATVSSTFSRMPIQLTPEWLATGVVVPERSVRSICSTTGQPPVEQRMHREGLLASLTPHGDGQGGYNMDTPAAQKASATAVAAGRSQRSHNGQGTERGERVEGACWGQL